MTRHSALIICLFAGAVPMCSAALDGSMCQLAMQAVPAAAYFGIMPADPAMRSDKDLFCSVMKDHGHFNSDGSEKLSCSAKTLAQCYDGCEWDAWKKTCKLFEGPKLRGIVNPDVGSPAKVWLDQMVACNKLNKTSCATEACAYKDAESKCDISTAALKNISCAYTGSEQMFKLYLTCSAISKQEDCTGQCKYKEKQQKCDMDPLAGYKLFFGEISGAKLDAMGTKTSVCSDIGINVTKCQASSQCKVGLLGCALAVHPDLKKEMDACKAISQISNCTATPDCAWNSNTQTCDVHPSKTGKVCGWPTPSPTTSEPQQDISSAAQPSIRALLLLASIFAASIAVSALKA